MRLNEAVIALVNHFVEHEKPIAAICHGLQILAAAGALTGTMDVHNVTTRSTTLTGKTCTAYPACGPEVTLAGGKMKTVAADEVVVDGKLITAPAWPAHPRWLAALLKALGTDITL